MLQIQKKNIKFANVIIFKFMRIAEILTDARCAIFRWLLHRRIVGHGADRKVSVINCETATSR